MRELETRIAKSIWWEGTDLHVVYAVDQVHEVYEAACLSNTEVLTQVLDEGRKVVTIQLQSASINTEILSQLFGNEVN